MFSCFQALLTEEIEYEPHAICYIFGTWTRCGNHR